ncbi:hypothetical protein FHS16_005417 [Paenibacillus endophyticus]|uniref:Uncharacterized protein n=1 Tax=Paenibacillus endophyticus TaxID=1294268 RepID=A0A7W5CDQ7_9BACL|nr:hypothetical protein [Paenibacillus endophyticus]
MIRKKGKEFLALMDRWSSLGIEREAIMKERGKLAPSVQ